MPLFTSTLMPLMPLNIPSVTRNVKNGTKEHILCTLHTYRWNRGKAHVICHKVSEGLDCAPVPQTWLSVCQKRVGTGPAVLLFSLCEAPFHISSSFIRKYSCSVVTYVIQAEDLQVINTNLCFGDALFILAHSVFLKLSLAFCSCFLPSCWFSIIKSSLKQS